MSTLYNILNSTLSLLALTKTVRKSGDENLKENCQRLATALSQNVGSNLRNAFTYLRTAVADLAICYENLQDFDQPGVPYFDNPDADRQLIFYTPDGLKLLRELRVMKSKAKFSFAKENFRKCNEACTNILQNASVSLNERITATKVRLIAEIMGNVENLVVATENCVNIIKEFHDSEGIRSFYKIIQTIPTTRGTRAKFKMFVSKLTDVQTHQSEEVIILTSIIKINVTVFNFIKKFIRKPVGLFDWPVIKAETSPQTFHPIIGQPARIKIDKRMQGMPDFPIRIESNGLDIDARISAINCKGEVLVFVKHKESWSALARIADGMSFPFWSLTDEKAKELKILGNIQIISISVDCNECTVSSRKSGEFHKDCRNRVYVLATYTSERQKVFVMFVIDVQGKLLHKAELTFLPRRDVSKKISCKIFCTKDKVIIFDIYRKEAYLCDREGELEKPLDVAALSYIVSTIPNEDEVVCMKSNKIHYYNIGGGSFLADQQFEICNEMRAIAFNHTSNEVNVLCKSDPSSRECHLMRYTKKGELQQDIKLDEDMYDFTYASLISHPSGPVVLLDNNTLLYLQ